MPLLRRFRLSLTCVVTAVALVGCGTTGPADQDAAAISSPAASPTESPAGSPAASPAAGSTPADTTSAAKPPAPPCESPLDDLTQRQRIAQLFTVGVSSVEDARRAVLDHSVGGIFLGSNVVGEVVAGDGLDRLHRDSPLPLLVAIDEEGGRVSRIAPYAGPLPSARVMAATMTPEQVRDAARVRGEYLRDMGVTVDFAPSLDVSDQPDQAVIGDRSFSPDPALVTRYAGAFAAGLLDAGITPVFKHFPGHGHSSGDSHHQAVTVPPLEQLIRSDLRPFADLAATPGAAMMLGHQQSAGLTEPGQPASLSPAAYQLLRDGHGYGAPAFDGPIFTDDLSGMRAITDSVPLPQAVTEALAAGADSPLWITTAGLGQVLDTAEQALAEGRLDRGELDRSLERVARLRGITVCTGGPVTGQVEDAGSLAAPLPDLPAAARKLTALPA